MPSGKRHYQLTIDDALRCHDDALTRGGVPGFISRGNVESAVQRPYSGYYPTMAQKCAALTESICRNHGFTDGNKRTCLLLVYVLLDRSGYKLVAIGGEDKNTALEELIVRTAEGALTYAEILAWYRWRLVQNRQAKRK